MAEIGLRAFHVALREPPGRGLVVQEASFEAAAIAFLERETAAEAEAAVVVVCDAETGHERCLRIDLATG
jgi:hypothetical protein